MIGMAAMILGDDIDRDAAVDREGLLFAVQRTIQCQASGVILDVRRAVLLTIITDRGRVAMVLDGAAYDKLGGLDHVRATAAHYKGTYEVTDGRDYTASGALRKAVRKEREALRAAQEAPPVVPVQL